MSELSGKPSAIPHLLELAMVFLRLGLTSFGGPAAHIGLLESEVVQKRNWLTSEEFLDLLGATNLIPGPNSTEMAIHIGFKRCGWPGLIVAGTAFILPAALLVGVAAWAYVTFGAIPQVAGVLTGVKPVIITIVVLALWNLSKSCLKSRFLALVGATALLTTVFGLNEIVVLVGSGFAVGSVRGFSAAEPRRRASSLVWLCLISTAIVIFALTSGMAGEQGAESAPFHMSGLFAVFFKIGSVLYGSGYVLLAFLRAQLVTRLHWLTQAQLLDAVVIGQVTPGPLFTTATFIGYLLGGPVGAIVATVGIFLPAFLLVSVSGPLIPKLRKSPIAGAFLDGVNVASLALMATVTWELGRSTIRDPASIAMTVVSAVLLIRYRVESMWLIFGGAAIGLIMNR